LVELTFPAHSHWEQGDKTLVTSINERSSYDRLFSSSARRSCFVELENHECSYEGGDGKNRETFPHITT